MTPDERRFAHQIETLTLCRVAQSLSNIARSLLAKGDAVPADTILTVAESIVKFPSAYEEPVA